ncbi:MAG TPA: flagellar motor protein MotB [Acidimicrobiales bacterium]|nr:flagellar motor protein MotB [Acidimicrobiales bacterium]
MSRRRKHQEHEEEVENSERWLLTYADMITLLLALFIVLFAVSSINSKKFLALALGLKNTFDPKPGVLPNGSGLLQEASLTKTSGTQMDQKLPTVSPLEPGVTASTTSTTLPQGVGGKTGSGNGPVGPMPLNQIQQQVENALAAKGLTGAASTLSQTRGLVVQVLADKVFFETDSADLGPVGDSVVDALAGVLQGDTNAVVVEGYTDNQPIIGPGPFTSNLELSAVRAVNVAQRLTGVDGLDPSRIAAKGYGETHPAYPNDSPEHQAMNRRIDVVILGPSVSQP